MIFKNMDTSITERIKSGCPWEVEPEEGRGETTKLFKPCMQVTLSKQNTHLSKGLECVKAFCRLTCTAASASKILINYFLFVCFN